MNQLNCILIFLACVIPANGSSQQDSVTITLAACTNAALKYHPAISASASELEIAGINIKSVKSSRYPNIATSFSGGFSNVYNKGNNYSTGNWTVSASETIWQKGNIRANIDQAGYNNQIAAASLESVKREITNRVKISYYNYYLQYNLYIIALDNVVKAKLFLDYAQEKFTLGTGRKTDILKAETDLKEAEFGQDSYQNAMSQSRNELIMLTSLSPISFNEPENPFNSDLLVAFNGLKNSSIQEALSMNPQIIISKNQILSQETRIRNAEAALYPRLNMEGGYNWSYSPMMQQQKGWYSALTLQWNIFNGNERKYGLQMEKVRKEVLSDQKTETENLLLKETNNRILNIINAENQIRVAESLMKTTALNLEISQEEYQTGVGSMLELTEARNSDLNARKSYETGVNAFLVALANLEQITENLNK